MQDETFTSADGLEIFIRVAPGRAPRAVIVINHGVNSHGGQYIWPTGQLRAAGFSVFAKGIWMAAETRRPASASEGV